MRLNTFFIVIKNAEQIRLEITADQASILAEANAKLHPFGDRARAAGESPIKAVFTYNDGNIVGLRGDLYTGKPVEMVKRLRKLIEQAYNRKQLHEVKIFDNRNIVPTGHPMIFHWCQGKGTLLNLLPLYSGEFDLKRVKQTV